MNIIKKNATIIPAILLACSAYAAEPVATGPVSFSTEKDTANFSANCKAITESHQTLFQYKALKCQAKGGVVMIKMTKEAIKRGADGAIATAMVAAGWSVNSDYYSESDNFVFNKIGGNGCLIFSGAQLAKFQDAVKKQKYEFSFSVGLISAAGKPVICPDFMK